MGTYIFARAIWIFNGQPNNTFIELLGHENVLVDSNLYFFRISKNSLKLYEFYKVAKTSMPQAKPFCLCHQDFRLFCLNASKSLRRSDLSGLEIIATSKAVRLLTF